MPASPYIDLTQDDRDRLINMVRLVLSYGTANHTLSLPEPPSSPGLQQDAASFVTLFENENLRGCTGSHSAHQPLWQDVCKHAYTSAFEDNRFAPLRAEELVNLSIQISILSPLTAIINEGEPSLIEQLQMDRDGVMIQEGRRTALFLPAVWRSFDDVKPFLRALRVKGGWPANYWSREMNIFRFRILCKIEASYSRE